MNILLFILTIVVSFAAVRMGAIAFQLTGLEWSIAKFQSLSCFTGTGFTTKEAEMITGYPRRRRIATILMVLGNPGFVTLIATFANSIRSYEVPHIELPFVHLLFPSYLLPWINLLIIAIAVFGMYRFFTHTSVAKRMTDFLRRRLIKRKAVRPVSFEELAVATQGYGVTSIEIGRSSPLAHHTIEEVRLRGKDISILAIEKPEGVLPNPSSETKVDPGDRLICFGKLDVIRREMVEIQKEDARTIASS